MTRWGFVAGTMTDEEIAIALDELHRDQESCRKLSTGKIMHNLVGIAGERKFAFEFDLFFDEQAACTRPEGDDGWDFEVDGIRTIDVKTAQKPNNLLVEKNKVKSDVYVLAGFRGDLHRYFTFLIGWATSEMVLSYEPKLWPKEVVNHIVPRHKLNPMKTLHGWVNKLRRTECVFLIPTEQKALWEFL